VLDEHIHAAAQRGEHLGERGDQRLAVHGKALELIEGERVDALARQQLRGRLSARDLIVMHHDHAVLRGVHVELDAVGAELQRPEERGERVLREFAGDPAVRDEARVLEASRHSSLAGSSRSP
jgi:hypothetical protein